jgi:hypothetical protein
LLKPGQTWRGAVSAIWHTDARSIVNEETTIDTLQRSRSPEISSAPRADWTAKS